MGICTGISALELAALAFSLLLAVLWLDMFWVRLPEELHRNDLTFALKKQGWLNQFVALGAATAAVMLFVWGSSCVSGA